MIKNFSVSSQNGPRSATETHSRDLLNTGVPGFDEILHGGLPKGHLYLIEGNPGTGKTTLAMQFLLAGIQNGERVLYITLSESEEELQEAMRSHGWSVDSLRICEMAPPEEDLKPETQYTVFHPSEVELADTIASIFKEVDAVQPQRLVFDSLSELRMLARDPLKYRRQILAFKRHLAGRDCTILLLDDGTAEGGHDLQLQSIAHGVVHLETINRDYGVNRRRIQVCKVRGSSFREGFHDYTIERGSISSIPGWSPRNTSLALSAKTSPAASSNSMPYFAVASIPVPALCCSDRRVAANRPLLFAMRSRPRSAMRRP